MSLLFHPPCLFIKYNVMYNTTGVARGTLMYSIPPAAEETCWQSDQMNYWVSLSAPDHALIIARTERRNVINGERERERGQETRGERELLERQRPRRGEKREMEGDEKRKRKPHLYVIPWNYDCSLLKAKLCCMCGAHVTVLPGCRST